MDLASAMSEIREILKDVQDDLIAIQAEVERLTFENGALRERLRLSEEESPDWDDPGKTVDESDYAPWRKPEPPPAVPYSDDELDAVRDRERDEEFERSTDRYDRGARD